MKKLIVFLFIISLGYMMYNEKDSSIVIPTDSIRFRVVANSNEDRDQILKLNVKDRLNEVIAEIESDSTSIEDSRKAIINSIPEIESTLSSMNLEYDINFGYNTFPKKEYKGITYNQGNYESLVVTIGKGSGDNWWCVLFPPLCTIEEETLENKEYTFLVKSIIDRF